MDYGGGRHPWEGETIPDYQPDSDRYSFAKAPRYRGKVVQLGPLAEFVIAGDPLITSFFKAEGPNTWLQTAGGKIKNYQVITPTSWNGSPRDSLGNAGSLGGKLYRSSD
jgi:Ni,Fe-hydrogenase I large subunit